MANGGFAEGMQGGMQLGLGMFNAMQNASYQQQLMRNADENQEMRKQDQQLKQQQFIAEQQKKAADEDTFVLTHPEAFPKNIRLNAVNRSNQRLAGENARPISELAVDAFEADLRGLPARLKETNSQEGMKAVFAEMEAKAHENPLFLQAWQTRKPVYEQIMQQQGFYDTFTELTGELMSEKRRHQLVERTDPKVLNKILEDKDYQKMFISRQVEQNMQAYLSGDEKFSGPRLRDTLAMARMSGTKLGPDGEKLVKEYDTYQFYNQSAQSLTQARSEMDPLFMAVRTSPAAKQLLTEKDTITAEKFAHPKPGSPFGLLDYASEAQAAESTNARYESFMTENPAIAQNLKELAPKALQRTTAIERQLADLERQREMVEQDKLAPNRDMQLNLFNQQEAALKRDLGVWKPLADYQQDPNLQTLQKVFKNEDRLNNSLKTVSKLRDEARSASDRNADRRTDLDFTEANTKKATKHTEMLLNEFAAKNPGATEDQLRGKSAEFAKVAQKQYGQLPDSNAVLESFITKKTQQTLLTGEERKTVAEAEANVAVADTLIRDFKPEYFGSMDNAINSLKAKLPEGSPRFIQLSNEMQEYRQRVELFRTQYRKRIFGSSLTEGEKESALNSMINLDMGDSQAKATLREMKKWEQKAIESTKRNAQRSEQVKQGTDPYKPENRKAPKLTFGGFESFWQQNRDKYGNDMDQAAKDFKAANEG